MHNFKKLETELIVSYNLKYIDTIVYENLSNMISEIQKMIYGFKNKLD